VKIKLKKTIFESIGPKNRRDFDVIGTKNDGIAAGTIFCNNIRSKSVKSFRQPQQQQQRRRRRRLKYVAVFTRH